MVGEGDGAHVSDTMNGSWRSGPLDRPRGPRQHRCRSALLPSALAPVGLPLVPAPTDYRPESTTAPREPPRRKACDNLHVDRSAEYSECVMPEDETARSLQAITEGATGADVARAAVVGTIGMMSRSSDPY